MFLFTNGVLICITITKTWNITLSLKIMQRVVKFNFKNECSLYFYKKVTVKTNKFVFKKKSDLF